MLRTPHGNANGEGGILAWLFPQHQTMSGDIAKVIVGQVITTLVLIVIVCGYLVLIGIVSSTDSAHLPHDEIPGLRRPIGRRRSRKRSSKPGNDLGAIAASYARYSSDQQDASSIDQQQRKCRDAAIANRHELRPEFEFADQAVSGAKVDRQGFQQMLATAREGQFEVLYFESLSRLARELIISVPTLKELVYVHHVRIISTSEGLDSDRAGWELMAIFRSWMHGEFLTALRAAVLRGQEDAVRNDFSVGDWCFGYRSESIPGSADGRRGRNPKLRMRILIEEDHAKWVRQIFDWFTVERRSISWIARELTRRNAPKDHRATLPAWRTDYVVRALRNRKYIGIWPWGRKTNVRNPLTGKITQEDRSPEEWAEFERERPELRIIEDEQFFRAQGILDDNQNRMKAVRQPSGQVRGSTRDSQNPRHLLQQLIHCSSCGSTFKVAGAQGRYLKCDGYSSGRCPVRTQLPRERAERMILERIGQLILHDSVWRQEVVRQTLQMWSAQQQQQPAEQHGLERQIAALDTKMERILDAIELGGSSAELQDRLRQRRREREELQRSLASLNRQMPQRQTPPTAEWVAEQLQQLHTILHSAEPAAGVALRELIGGITVTEVTPEQRKQKFLRGEFAINRRSLIQHVKFADSEPLISESDRIIINFCDAPPWSDYTERVKELYDAGLRFRDIARTLGCHRTWAQKAFAEWHRLRGEPVPDGRTAKARLQPSSQSEALTERAKQLWDEGRPMQEIAVEMGCCRDTVTAMIRTWYSSRGMRVPDGRTRRKSLRRDSTDSRVR